VQALSWRFEARWNRGRNLWIFRPCRFLDYVLIHGNDAWSKGFLFFKQYGRINFLL